MQPSRADQELASDASRNITQLLSVDQHWRAARNGMLTDAERASLVEANRILRERIAKER